MKIDPVRGSRDGFNDSGYTGIQRLVCGEVRVEESP